MQVSPYIVNNVFWFYRLIALEISGLLLFQIEFVARHCWDQSNGNEIPNEILTTTELWYFLLKFFGSKLGSVLFFRPLSKTVRFNVLKVIPMGASDGGNKKVFTAVWDHSFCILMCGWRMFHPYPTEMWRSLAHFANLLHFFSVKFFSNLSSSHAMVVNYTV